MLIKELLILISALIFMLSQNSFASVYYTNNETLLIKKSIGCAAKNKWHCAYKSAKKIKDPVVLQLVTYLQIKQGKSNKGFDQLVKFYKTLPVYILKKNLISSIEKASLKVKNNKQNIINWYRSHPPSSCGAKKLYLKLIEYNNTAKDKLISKKLAKNIWIKCNFLQKNEQKFLAKHKNYLSRYTHVQKIEYLLAKKKTVQAKRNLRLVDQYHKKIYKARIDLIDMKTNPNIVISELATNFSNNPGLFRDIIIYNDNKKQYEANDILLGKASNFMLKHKYLVKFKSTYIRTAIARQNYQLAYKLASTHNHINNKDKANSEWLSGWISLRYLHKPKQARLHFHRMFHIVRMPISVSRAAYWIGRTFIAEGKKIKARQWFDNAAKYPTTFYGQLALIANNKKSFKIDQQIHPLQSDKIAMQNNIYAKLSTILAYYKDNTLLYKLLNLAIYKAKTRGEIYLIASISNDVKRKDFAINIAKSALHRKIYLTKFNYPIINLKHHTQIPHEFVLSLIRQESLFYEKAKSSAGAVGMMQIMPKIGRYIAQMIKDKFSIKMLNSNAKYNIKLGTYHLNTLLQKYNGSYILAAAAYNAGEKNVNRWIKIFNDPRKMETIDEIIDWIESITFYETRNYIQRVLESQQMYRSIINRDNIFHTKLDKDLLTGIII